MPNNQFVNAKFEIFSIVDFQVQSQGQKPEIKYDVVNRYDGQADGNSGTQGQ